MTKPHHDPQILFQQRLMALQAAGVRFFPKSPSLAPISTPTAALMPPPPGASARGGFFILTEFPDPSSVLLNLLKRLGLEDQYTLAHALEAFPEQNLTPQTFGPEVKERLLHSLQSHPPQVVFCFGARALAVLFWAMDWTLKSQDLFENQRLGTYPFLQANIEVFFLSSVKDLADHPSWRRNVWQVLEKFKAD